MASDKPIYLDYHATTPVDPRVLEAMMPYFTEVFGNPASKNHTFGNEAYAAVEDSRASLAKALNAKPQEIVFTSGATEAINLAIKGVAIASRTPSAHVITVATEHKAVLDCCEWLLTRGFGVTILPVGPDGMLDSEELEKAIRPETILVSVMAANNEIGVLQPLQEIGNICSRNGIYFMTDATQALGKMPIDVRKLNIDLLAASAHKVYGPKGIGLLYIRRSNPRVCIDALVHGGGHEKGLRSGTLPTPNIVGFAKAIEIAAKEMPKEQSRLQRLRDDFLARIRSDIPNIHVNGSLTQRLPQNLNISFENVESEALMIALKSEIAVSSGSACTTAAVLPSHVLKAIGLSDAQAHSSIRFGLGRFTTEEQLNRAHEALTREIFRLRRIKER